MRRTNKRKRSNYFGNVGRNGNGYFFVQKRFIEQRALFTPNLRNAVHTRREHVESRVGFLFVGGRTVYRLLAKTILSKRLSTVRWVRRVYKHTLFEVEEVPSTGPRNSKKTDKTVDGRVRLYRGGPNS